MSAASNLFDPDTISTTEEAIAVSETALNKLQEELKEKLDAVPEGAPIPPHLIKMKEYLPATLIKLMEIKAALTPTRLTNSGITATSVAESVLRNEGGRRRRHKKSRKARKSRKNQN
jgi:hypothetical protein